MAHSPAVLAGYLDSRTVAPRAGVVERLARLGCQTTLDAHIEAARRVGVSHQEIDAAALRGYVEDR